MKLKSSFPYLCFVVLVLCCLGCEPSTEDLADQAQRNGNWQKAYMLYQQAVREKPWDNHILKKMDVAASCLVAAALRHQQQGHYQAVLADLEPILKAHHDVADAYLLAAWALVQSDYLNMRNLLQALNLLNRCLAIQPAPLKRPVLPAKLQKWLLAQGIIEREIKSATFTKADSGSISRAFLYYDIVNSALAYPHSCQLFPRAMTAKAGSAANQSTSAANRSTSAANRSTSAANRSTSAANRSTSAAKRSGAAVQTPLQRLAALLDWLSRHLQPLSRPTDQLIMPLVLMRATANNHQLTEVCVNLARQAGLSAYPVSLAGQEQTLVTIYIKPHWWLVDPDAAMPLLDKQGRWIDLRQVIAHPEHFAQILPAKVRDFRQAVIWVNAPRHASLPRLQIMQRLMQGRLHLKSHLRIPPLVYLPLPGLFRQLCQNFYAKEQPADLDPYTVGSGRVDCAYWTYPYQVWRVHRQHKQTIRKLRQEIQVLQQRVGQNAAAGDQAKLRQLKAQLAQQEDLGVNQEVIKARVSHLRGLYQQAIKLYRQAPAGAQRDYLLGVALLEAGQWQAAVKVWRTVVNNYPHGIWQAAACYQLGRLYEAHGERALARTFYQQVKGKRQCTAHWRLTLLTH